MLYLINPRKRGAARKARKKRRTAAQKAATKKMLAARKRAGASKRRKSRTTKRSTSMARKARKRSSTRKRRRTARRRSPGVRLVRRGVAVYQGNPRRRRRGARRRGYRGNPGIVGIVKQGAMDAVATLGGGAAARIVTGFVPLPDAGIMGVAKGALVAVGIGVASRRFLSSDTARFVTAGAMQVPIKNLITTFLPQAGAYLGDESYPSFNGAEGDDMGAYLSGGESPADLYEGVGEYVESY